MALAIGQTIGALFSALENADPLLVGPVRCLIVRVADRAEILVSVAQGQIAVLAVKADKLGSKEDLCRTKNNYRSGDEQHFTKSTGSLLGEFLIDETE